MTDLRISWAAQLLILPLIAGVCWTSGCKPSDSPAEIAPAGQENSAATGAGASDGDTSIVVEPISVPDGTPEELFAFIDDLDAQLDLSQSDAADGEPSEVSADAQQAIALRRVMEARIDACDRILMRQVPEETRLRAIRIQLDALRTLVALDPEGMAERFEYYTQRIAAGNDPLLARMARATRYQSEVNRTLSGAGPPSEVLIANLQALLNDPDAGPEILNATREAATWMLQYGDLPTATQAFRVIGKRFQNHSDPTLADEGKSLVSQSINLELTRLARGVADQQPEAMDKLMAKVEELLAPDNDDPNVLAYAMQTAQLLEFSGHPAEALKAYHLIGRRYQDDRDTALAGDVKRSVSLADRRLNLIGNPLQLEGVKLDGRPFDWEPYRGKWVVVCFWTTWHEGWLAEAENIRKAISDYQDPAVEVVAISLDDDRNLLERFLKEHPTYWPVLVNPDPTTSGFENPNAVRCGVEAVPFIVLVDPQGRVVDVHLMGERLPASLAEHIKP